MPGQSHCRDSTPHTSRKQPVAKPPRLTKVTPTQSLAQKTPKLKSLVQRAPTTKNYRDPPYNSLDKDPKEFVRYLMGNLDRKAYDVEIRCLATFYSQATVLAHCVIASTITTLVATNRGVHFLAPFIPRELMNSPPNPLDAEPPLELPPTVRIIKQMSESTVSGNGCIWCISYNTGTMLVQSTPRVALSDRKAS